MRLFSVLSACTIIALASLVGQAHAANHVHHAGHNSHDDHAGHAGPGHQAILGAEITNPWMRATPAVMDGSAIYMHIANLSGEDITLTGASSPFARKVELHESFTNPQGVIMMRPLAEPLTIAPGGHVALQPGGLHIMLIGLTAPLTEGLEVPLTLEFAGGHQRNIRVPVQSRTYTPAGHAAPAGAAHHHH